MAALARAWRRRLTPCRVLLGALRRRVSAAGSVGPPRSHTRARALGATDGRRLGARPVARGLRGQPSPGASSAAGGETGLLAGVLGSHVDWQKSAPVADRRCSDPRGSPGRSRVLRAEAWAGAPGNQRLSQDKLATEAPRASEAADPGQVPAENAGTSRGRRLKRVTRREARRSPSWVSRLADVDGKPGCSLTSWVRTSHFDASRLGDLRQEAPRETLVGPAVASSMERPVRPTKSVRRAAT